MRSLVYVPPPSLTHFTHRSSPAHQTTTLALPRVLLANETRRLPEVPDSVDPFQPIRFTQDESVARSVVEDAHVGVAWEILHGGVGAVQEERAQKRVRIRTSPVLVIETPERRWQGEQRKCKGLLRDEDEVEDAEEKGEEAGDKSRVVLGEEDQSEDEHGLATTSDSIAVGNRPSILADETSVGLADPASRAITEADQERRSDARFDLSLLAAVPTSRAAAVAADQELPDHPDDPPSAFPAIPASRAATISADPQGSDQRNASSSILNIPTSDSAHIAEQPGGTNRRYVASPLAAIPISQAAPAAADQQRSDASALADIPAIRAAPTADLSLLAAIPIPRAAAAHAANQTTPSLARPDDTTTRSEHSTSSLLIRAPIPAPTALAAPTCRFRFFSRPPAPLASQPSIASAADPLATKPANGSSLHHHGEPGPKTTTGAGSPPLAPGEPSIRATLPTMNAYEASYDSLPSHAESYAQQHSILPPPTLHFALADVTPISRLLADPVHFISPHRAVGGVSCRVHLLVVVRQVGEVMRVRSKLGVDPGRAFGGRSEMRGLSGAFRQAAGTVEGGGGDGKTERLELVVMDGRMSAIRRLISADSESWSVVEEPAEKHVLRVVLWGKLARDWSSCATGSSPTALRNGDVVSLTNLSLSRTPAEPHTTTAPRRSRLGTGLPSNRTLLTAHASTANQSTLQLCFRTHALSAQDKARNFDHDLAAFDLTSRRVLELSRLWSCGAPAAAAG